MLAVARAKAGEAGVSVGLVRANLTQLDGLADACFDYAACLFSTLGMVLGRSQRERAVAHAFRVLRPGGRLVLHVHNRWFNVWDRAGRAWLVRDWLRGGGGDRPMPVHQGVAGLSLHHFTAGEARRLLTRAGFRLLEVRPVGLRPDGGLRRPGWFGWLRAYGYLLAAERPMA
jgi:SAM-dependent methyltransferase